MTIKQIIDKYLPKNPDVSFADNIIRFKVDSANLAHVLENIYINHKLPLKTAFATDEREIDKSYKIHYVFGIPVTNFFIIPFITLENTIEFPSLTTTIHELNLLELEIYTFFGLKPVGHPNLQKIILHDNWPDNIYPLRKDFRWDERVGYSNKQEHQFKVVKGEGIYEIPVGPIHAGIIEPGHFRFSVAGEEIIVLEPQLGYVHKGIEKLFENLLLSDKIKLSERVSGDSSFNHSLAFCQALENLCNLQIPKRAKYLRVVFAELERLANHFNDFGFIMNDTAFTFGGAQGARLREIIMQINENLTGSRYLRGVNILGGVSIDISKDDQNTLLEDLKVIAKDYTEVLEISQNSTSMMNRLKGSGILDKQVAIDHGVVGIVARALGLRKDARIDNPYAAYAELNIKVAVQHSGDVFARFEVRTEEIYNSLNIIKQALEKLPSGPISSPNMPLRENSEAIGITEGWRGEIVYFVTSDDKGEISRVVVRDPSFLNWPVVPYAVVGNPVPEFPLINKSFNLSYSGNDK